MNGINAPQRPDCMAGHIGLELANVALTRRDLNRSLPGVREKSLVRKCCVNPRSSAEITKNRHFRVRVLSPQPRSPVSTVIYRSAFPVRLSASCHAAGPRIEPCWPHFVGLMASPAGAVELLRCVSARVE